MSDAAINRLTAPELRIDGPNRLPEPEAVRAVVELCLALPDKQALTFSDTYRRQGWNDLVSFLPEGLDTEEGIRGSLDHCTERLLDCFAIDKRRLSIAWEKSPELVIGSYAIQDGDLESGIWRGVGLWAAK